MRILLGFCLILGASLSARTNVLFIVIDDLNDWVGCLGGHPQAQTPNIDRLAARGVLFSNAHCQAPICNPSRTSFMLGLRPSTTGVYQNNPWFRDVVALSESVSLTQHFRGQGYRVFTTGKIFHGSRVDRPSFDVVGPRQGQRIALDQQLQADIPTKTRLWDWGPQEYPENKFGDFVDANWAIDRLKEKHDKPFFLATGLYRPHVPMYAPKRFFDRFPLSDIKLPKVIPDDRSDLSAHVVKLVANSTPPPHEWWVRSGQWDAGVQAYLASTSFVDAQVGRLLDALDASPHALNTIVVLLSDHGFHLGEKEVWAKRTLWERSTRVPLIISIPGRLRPGVCSRPVELLSLYPTLVELCGLPVKSGLDGTSMVSLLEKPGADWDRPAITTFTQNNHAVRSVHWRYIRYADGSEELYDHREDPEEWNNLAGKPGTESIIAAHKKWLPGLNVPEASAAKGIRKSRKIKAEPR
jgi:choline-sulfatase